MSKQTKPEICECKYPTYEAGTVTCIKCNKTIPTPEPFHKPEQDVVSNRITELEGLLRDAAVRLERITYQHKEQKHTALSDRIREALEVNENGS